MAAPSYSSKPSGARADLENLLSRIRRRHYHETIPVLVSYWLKAVYAAGHPRAWWKELNGLLKHVLRDEPLDAIAREALADVQSWIRQSGVLRNKNPEAPPPRTGPFRANLQPERLQAYLGRLLNEWLSAEEARILVNEGEWAAAEVGGIPVLTAGRAIERLLVRERLSPETLEALLDPQLYSPRDFYPGDLEMLHDVLLALIGRTDATPLPVLPATLLGVSRDAHLPADYSEAVKRAVHALGPEGEELRVGIAPETARAILAADTVRIASVVVTMDGRYWESESLQRGEQDVVVYRPVGRLRIDYSADHARLDVRWPEAQLHWESGLQICGPFELFGREWRAMRWQTDGAVTWLRLEFERALPVEDAAPDVREHVPRVRSAAVDMAWAAMENALAEGLAADSREPIEQLRRPDFIPLGRALFELSQAAKRRRPWKRETIETQLRAVRYLQTSVSAEYGRVPWRILPTPVRAAFLKRHDDPEMRALAREVFDELPSILSEQPVHPPEADSASPSQAA